MFVQKAIIFKPSVHKGKPQPRLTAPPTSEIFKIHLGNTLSKFVWPCFRQRLEQTPLKFLATSIFCEFVTLLGYNQVKSNCREVKSTSKALALQIWQPTPNNSAVLQGISISKQQMRNHTPCICFVWAGLGDLGRSAHRAAVLPKNRKGFCSWQQSLEESPSPLFSMTLVCFLLLSCWTPWISMVTLGSTMEFLLLFTFGSC